MAQVFFLPAARPTAEEFRIWIAHIILIVICFVLITLVAGWVAAAMCLSPFIFAILFAPCAKPGPCNVLTMVVFLFMLMSIWSKCFLVGCRMEWEKKFQRETKFDWSKSHRTIGLRTSDEGIEVEADRVVFNSELRKWCSNRTWHEEEYPEFYPLFHPNAGVVTNITKHRFFLMKCPQWMCTFTEQHNHTKYALLAVFGVMFLMNVLYVFVPCPGVCNRAQECYGCGRCRLWWFWVWVWFIPMWVVSAVTFQTHFDYGDLSAWAAIIFNAVLEDSYRTLLICLIVLIIILFYVNRETFYKALGIDDRNIVRYSTLGGGSLGCESVQVCLWRVDANQRAVREVQFGGDNPDFRAERLTKKRSWLQILFRTNPESGEVDREDDDEQRLIPSIGRTANLFVRVASGDNEVQTSRVIRLPMVMHADTTVPFREIFCVDMEVNKDKDVNLHVEVCDQNLLGRQELGRVSLRYPEIRSAIRRGEQVLRTGVGYSTADLTEPLFLEGFRDEQGRPLRHKAPDIDPMETLNDRSYALGYNPRMGSNPNQLQLHSSMPPARESTVGRSAADADLLERILSRQDGKPAAPAERQAVSMMKRNPKLGTEELSMFKEGFKPYPLNQGGTVWLAFARLDSAQETERGCLSVICKTLPCQI